MGEVGGGGGTFCQRAEMTCLEMKNIALNAADLFLFGAGWWQPSVGHGYRCARASYLPELGEIAARIQLYPPPKSLPGWAGAVTAMRVARAARDPVFALRFWHFQRRCSRVAAEMLA